MLREVLMKAVLAVLMSRALALLYLDRYGTRF